MDDRTRTPGKGKRRILLWIGGGLVVLLAVGLVAALLVARHYLGEDRFVAMVESSNNCRLQIGSLKSRLFGSPARIALTDVVFLPRDAVADAGTPHSGRARAEPRDGLKIGALTLEASALDLLLGELNVKSLAIDRLEIATLVDREGGHSLEGLFDPPATVGGVENPAFEKEQARRDGTRERRKLSKEERVAHDEKKRSEGGFNVAEIPMPATLRKFRITNSEVDILVRKTQNRISLSEVNISLDDLDIDPGDLENHNFARLSGEARLVVNDRLRENQYADMRIALSGDIAPFDPLAGNLNPNLNFEVTARKGSTIVELPPLQRLGRNIVKWRKFGVQLEDLGSGIDFHDDSTLRLGYDNGTLSLVEDGPLQFSGNTLTLYAGSWLDFPSDLHEMKAGVVLSQEYSAQSRARTLASLTEKYGISGDIVESMADILLAPLVKGDRLVVGFTSSGSFSKPSVLPDVGELKDASRLLKNEAKEKALDLLEGLLDQ